MTAPIGAIGAVAPVGSPMAVPAPTGADAAGATGGTSAGNFAAELGRGLDAVSQSQTAVDKLNVAAATGQQIDPAAVTVAATQAQLMTQLAATVQSKAVAAFNTIMGMQA